jgi:hypothetical protein
MTARTRTPTEELSALIDRLPRRERRGSRPRCLLLTHGSGQRVADRLTTLTTPGLVVNSSDLWFPGGFAAPTEITLGHCDEALLSSTHQAELVRWWLATTGRLPTWDLVALGSAGRTRALLLVEAKAHVMELGTRSRAKRSPANQRKITRALDEASRGLDAVMPGWDLVNAHYQLANRIAWAWKLASMGVPVLLVYLGFLHATDVADLGEWFLSHAAWEETVRAYSRHTVPAEAWGRRIPVGRAWIQLEIRSTHVPLPMPCTSCGAQLRWILRGLPTEEASRAAESGAFVLGGCMVGEDDPTHECERCGAEVRSAGAQRLPGDSQ